MPKLYAKPFFVLLHITPMSNLVSPVVAVAISVKGPFMASGEYHFGFSNLPPPTDKTGWGAALPGQMYLTTPGFS